MKGEKLTAREEEFCRQYVVLRNGARAAVAAGYSEKRARQTAHELGDVVTDSQVLDAEVATILKIPS